MFAMTERGHGSNVRGIQTEATFDLSAQVRILPIVSQCRVAGNLLRTRLSFFLRPTSHLPRVLSGLRHSDLEQLPKCFSGGGHMLSLHVSNVRQHFLSSYHVQALLCALYLLF